MKRSSGKTAVRGEVRELSMLFEISEILRQSMDLHEVVGPVLEAMAKHMGMVRGTITLLNRQTGEILIEAAHGLSPSQRERGRYQLGEGVTGRVVATGRPAVVPRISEEPLFLDRTGARKGLSRDDISFICVPIKLGNKVIGALSADRLFSEEVSFEEDVRLLSIIASLIAQSVRLRQSAEEERQRLIEENIRLQEELRERFHPANIIGTAKVMQGVYDLIAQVAKSDATVLIEGESGTGKELVAHAIHYHSLRATKPFVRVHCAALPDTVIESELFGHEKGAFTGAIAQRKGRFELAQGGSIFLDEVGDLSASTQIKLLRVLQEREFERVGGRTPITVDVRVLSATNKDLRGLAEAGEFREDLFFRLNVVTLEIPPLREREGDVELLVRYFLSSFGGQGKRKTVTDRAMAVLKAYPWPGNVRELKHCLENAVIMSEGEEIDEGDLPRAFREACQEREKERSLAAMQEADEMDLDGALDEVERRMIVRALERTKGIQVDAAHLLKVTPRSLRYRMRKHGLQG